MRKLFLLLLTNTLFILPVHTQEVLLEGYVFESGNRGYLNAVQIQVKEKITNRVIAEGSSNMEGKFSIAIPVGEFVVLAQKDLFHVLETPISIKAKKKKQFIKMQMHRKPGYIFDVTMAEKLIKGKEQVDAITDSKIEVYNNTIQEPVMELDNHPVPTFKVTFERGNHYTIMIRKEGYFTKRLEAYVDVKGCILCFDGVGNVQPGVSDVLTERNQMGTLLANIELQPLLLNEGFELKNIYYDLNSAKLRPEAEKELTALVGLLKDNPGVSVEIGAHTDARGEAAYNKKLSQKRAQSVVKYLATVGKIDEGRLVAKGYGETVLINNCRDGVKCSERKHQKNRRTELIVLSLEDEDRFRDQRLAEIIQLENLTDEIIEVGMDGQLRSSSGKVVSEGDSNTSTASKTTYTDASPTAGIGGQIKVAPGQALPDEILRDIEQQNRRNSSARASDKQSRVRRVPATRPTTQPVQKREEEVVQVPATRATRQPAQRESATNNAGQVASNTTVYQENIGETLVKVASSQYAKPKSSKPAAVPIKTSPKTLPAADKKMGESVINRPVKKGKTRTIASGFTGYQIEFLLTEQPINDTNPIFYQHGNIISERRESGTYAYLLGDFKEKRDAAIFLREVILPRYNTAKLVYYIKGRRVGYVHGREINNAGMPPR